MPDDKRGERSVPTTTPLDDGARLAALTPAQRELHGTFVQSTRELRANTARTVLLLTAVADGRLHLILGFASLAEYAQHFAGFSPRLTRDFLSLGRKLRALPKVAEAVQTGSLPWTKAREICRHADPQDQGRMLELARSCSRRELERMQKVARTTNAAPAQHESSLTTPASHEPSSPTPAPRELSSLRHRRTNRSPPRRAASSAARARGRREQTAALSGPLSRDARIRPGAARAMDGTSRAAGGRASQDLARRAVARCARARPQVTKRCPRRTRRTSSSSCSARIAARRRSSPRAAKPARRPRWSRRRRAMPSSRTRQVVSARRSAHGCGDSRCSAPATVARPGAAGTSSSSRSITAFRSSKAAPTRSRTWSSSARAAIARCTTANSTSATVRARPWTRRVTCSAGDMVRIAHLGPIPYHPARTAPSRGGNVRC